MRKIRLDSAKRLLSAPINTKIGFTFDKKYYKVYVVSECDLNINPPCIACAFSSMFGSINAECPTINGQLCCRIHRDGYIRFMIPEDVSDSVKEFDKTGKRF